MAKAINRAEKQNRTRAGIAKKSFPEWQHRHCVFISHHKSDSQASAQIADYFIEAGVDVYFDQYEQALSSLAATADADKITQHIRDGVDFSTHMLCVVSPNTIKSYWVPFEVGYGYKKVTLGVLTLAGITDAELPEYMKTTKVIRGTKSLNEFLADLLNERKDSFEMKSGFRSGTPGHRLSRILDMYR